MKHVVALMLVVLCGCGADRHLTNAGGMERIVVSPDGRGFVTAQSGEVFVPWGFNYDHDAGGRLLEDYWASEWDAVVEDFGQMKALGATVVRVHLQTGRFMEAADRTNAEALRRLGMLVELAQRTGLYLDITGLGCYHKEDVPAWYDALDEADRWDVQAKFWTAVAQVCADSPAVFCYDLMNEPVAGGGEKLETSWLAGEPFGGSYFVQRINLEARGRTAHEIAAQWTQKLTRAIRREDPSRLITVGAIPWSMTWPNAKPIFYSPDAARHLDFVSVHFYPKQGQVDKALAALAVYDIGKPIVIEEMFNLSCDINELDKFIDGSRPKACGWIGFFWGKGIDEYKALLEELKQDPKADQNQAYGASLMVQWLEYFTAKGPELRTRYLFNFFTTDYAD